MVDADRKHAHLDLQVSLLAEHEVTKIVTLVTAIADHLGLNPDVDREELEELKQHVAPETVLDQARRFERLANRPSFSFTSNKNLCHSHSSVYGRIP